MSEYLFHIVGADADRVRLVHEHRRARAKALGRHDAGGIRTGKNTDGAHDEALEWGAALVLGGSWQAYDHFELPGPDVIRSRNRTYRLLDAKNSRNPERHFITAKAQTKHTENQDIDAYVFGHCYEDGLGFHGQLLGWVPFEDFESYAHFGPGNPPCWHIDRLRPMEELT